MGRIRKDAKLHFFPELPPGAAQRGRPRRYGVLAPTPARLRTDDAVPWTSLEVLIGGVLRTLRVKRLPSILWRTAGLQHTLQPVVVAPVG